MPNFAPDNTPPTSTALAVEVPDNTAPGAIAQDWTPSNNAPGSKVPGVPVPDNTAPVAVALPDDMDPDNVAPGAKQVDHAPDNTAPGASQVDHAPSNAAPGSKVPGVPVPDNTAPGAHATGSFEPTADVPQPVYFTPPANPTDDTVNTPVINLPGALQLNAITGWARIPANSNLTRAQVQLAEPPDPAGDDAEIQLVDSAGDPIGVTITVPAGETYGQTIPGAPIALAADAYVRAKCLAMGSAAQPGGFGLVTLFTQLA